MSLSAFVTKTLCLFSTHLILFSELGNALPRQTIQSRERSSKATREIISLNDDWRFWRSETIPDGLIYDSRPETENYTDLEILKPWVLPSANHLIQNPADRHQRPSGNPSGNLSLAQIDYDDSSWEDVRLPHDWAIGHDFFVGDDPVVGGYMGRLPVHGVGWYRRKVATTQDDEGKTIYLDVDGAMAYATVWLNGHLLGGWPYGYNSFRLDLTPYLQPSTTNQLAIRLDNPNNSSRWYPGGGIYRDVWLTKVSPVHVAQWGTYIRSRDVTSDSATLDLSIQIQGPDDATEAITVHTDVYMVDPDTDKPSAKVASFPDDVVTISDSGETTVSQSLDLTNPRLWQPSEVEPAHLYVAITKLEISSDVVDTYQTRFGVRDVRFDPDAGLLVNGHRIPVRGVNQHHDLGALGAAFNLRAAERQLAILRDMGCNAVRMSHNPPAPALLDLADRMGFVVLDEVFDTWTHAKTANDFHLIFADWHEADARALLRRDRNHPSIVTWSFGNEVQEQLDGAEGAARARALHDLMRAEGPTRPAVASMNYAQPDDAFSDVVDMITLNYQGDGIRDTPAYSGLNGSVTPPLYDAFRAAFPGKMIWNSESASALSSRGTYLFPVTELNSAPINDSSGGDSAAWRVSSYELYSADYGASADKVFAAEDSHPFVAGEFVWSGFDYLGEPTPYAGARSSYSGIVDTAGFPKDRFYLYRSRWRPDLRAAHIVPQNWNWEGRRDGQATPVHVFAAADEAELFLNGQSLGRRARTGPEEQRFRWDDVAYAPGELTARTWKGGQPWADAPVVRTTGPATALRLSVENQGRNYDTSRSPGSLRADGVDLAFVAVAVVDDRGDTVPDAADAVRFEVVGGPADLLATDSGDQADMVGFASPERRALAGRALAILRGRAGEAGEIVVRATAGGLRGDELRLEAWL